MWGLVLLLIVNQCTAAGNDLRDIPEVICEPGSDVVLDVRAARMDIDGEVQFTTRVYHWDGVPQFPGPTIKMKAGVPCVITVINSLNVTFGVDCATTTKNDFHCPDETNLHTHGLHVSPYEDNIDTRIDPGTELSYSYNIPADHLMGTHWAHAHMHGSTSLQVLGGMVAALIMEPADDYALPPDLAALYLDNERTKVLVLAHHLHVDDAGNGAFVMWSYQSISDRFDIVNEGSQTIQPNIVIPNNNHDFYSVNGQYQPVVEIMPGDATLLRLVHASGQRIIELQLTGAGSGQCNMTMIARDGVFQATPYLGVHSVVMVQGTRTDIVLYCPAASAGRTLTMTASPLEEFDDILSTTNRHTQGNVFSVRVAEAATETRRVPSSQAPMPAYYNDLREETPTTGTKNVSHIRFNFGNGQQDGINDVPFPGYDAPEEDRYIDEYCVGQVVELDIGTGDPIASTSDTAGRRLLQGRVTSPHPYHQHINHMQIAHAGADTSGGLVVREGEWRDVVPALSAESVVVRFILDRFDGDVILHCHILQHEDRGMMALYRINDCSCPEPEFTPPANAFPLVLVMAIAGGAVVVLVVMGAAYGFSSRRRGNYVKMGDATPHKTAMGE